MKTRFLLAIFLSILISGRFFYAAESSPTVRPTPTPAAAKAPFAQTGTTNVTGAGLKWEQTAVELHPAAGDKQAIAHFKYQNAGDKVVHFASVKSSCGCTVAQPQKNDVQPGEKGEITATFNIGDRVGPQSKQVTVVTDYPGSPMQILRLTTIVPQPVVELNPMFVYWNNGDEAKAKSVTAKVAGANNLTATSSSPDLQTKVEKIGDGQFKIDIQPRDTTKPITAAVTVHADNINKSGVIQARVIAPANPPGSTASPASKP